MLHSETVLPGTLDLLKELQRLAENFYNDTWLMDQNACSSPQLICWIPPTDRFVQLLNSAQDRFWSAAESVARSRYRLQDAIAVDKLTLACEEAVTNGSYAALSHTTNLLYREELVSLPADLLSRRGKAGYFFEYTLPALPQAEDSTAESSRFNLEALVPMLSEKVHYLFRYRFCRASCGAYLRPLPRHRPHCPDWPGDEYRRPLGRPRFDSRIVATNRVLIRCHGDVLTVARIGTSGRIGFVSGRSGDGTTD